MLLDAKAPIDLTDDEIAAKSNAIGALESLAVGLGSLYGKVRVIELNFGATLPDSTSHEYFMGGNIPGLEPGAQALLECVGQWYSVSICSFVRGIAFLGSFDDDQRREYLKVLEPVNVFRDKIGAHLAGTTENKKDNPAERLASVLPQVTWRRDRFQFNSLTLRLKRGTEVSTSETLKPWSLTERHEFFAQRYPMLSATMPEFVRNS